MASNTLIPRSVTFRSAGYARIPRTQQWIPESVLRQREEQARLDELARPLRLMAKYDPVHQAIENGVSWGELMQREERRGEFQEPLPPMPVQPKTPAYWYNEYLNFPHLYFANEEEQRQAIAEVLEEWSVGVGRWRVGRMETAAVKIQQWWAEKLRARWWAQRLAEAQEAEAEHAQREQQTREFARATWDQEAEATPERVACRLCMRNCAEGCTLCVDCFNAMAREGSTFSRRSDGEHFEPDFCQGCGWDYAAEDGLCVDCLELRQLQEEQEDNPLRVHRCQMCEESADTYEMEDGSHLCEQCIQTHTPCYCRDWLCDGRCGVLACGCIDTCRCADSWRG